MENKKTTEILPEGSEKKMNENTCKHKELYKYLWLCEILQEFEESCEENHSRDTFQAAGDMENLILSIYSKFREYLPFEDDVKMYFIIDLVGDFISKGYYDIDPLFHIFIETIQKQVLVYDKEEIEACRYVLGCVSMYTYEL